MSNSSKHEFGFSYINLLRRSRSLGCKIQNSACALPNCVKDVLFGTYGKQPFDCGHNGYDKVHLKIGITRFYQVVYSHQLAKKSLLHMIFHVYVLKVESGRLIPQLGSYCLIDIQTI